MKSYNAIDDKEKEQIHERVKNLLLRLATNFTIAIEIYIAIVF
jgi:hypothetical protein